MRSLTILTLLLWNYTTWGQVFTDVSQAQGIYHSYVGGEYGGGVSFYDADGDGWDDLTFCSKSQGIRFFKNNEGNFEEGVLLIQSNDEFKSAHWVDYDNDGDADLFVTRYLSNWSLYQNNGSIYNLEDVTEAANLPAATVYETMGHSWGDIDKDGDLDLYICNYNSIGATNLLFQNNGDGTFTDITAESGTADGNKSSFQSLFADLNHNRKLDLFVINDRTPYSNSYYKNEVGVFSDITTISGMEIYMCSMNTSIADYDHDGDFDMYISNSLEGNYLLNNDISTGVFTNVAENAGVAVFQRSWSALWVDYDNDGWEDLHVCKNPFGGFNGQNKLFQNNQDGTFTDVTNSNYLPSSPNSASYSSAQGDFNKDGYVDIVVLNQAPHNAELLVNAGGDNNYITVELEGVFSNKDAIGSRIDLWADDQHYIRFTHCGEGFLTQNSNRKIIGIGSAETIDSIRVEWPNDLTEMWYDIPANEKLILVEGEVTNQLIAQSTELLFADTSLCGLDSLLLVAGNSDNITWSSGDQTDSLWVDTVGDYWYEFEFNGEVYYSDTVSITGNEAFSADFTSLPALCFGETTGEISIELDPNHELSSYTVNGEPEVELSTLAAGTYHISVTNEFGCVHADSIEVTSPPQLQVDFIVDQALCFGEVSTVEAEVSGGTPSYVTFWQGFNPNNANPGIYFPYVTDSNGCLAEGVVTIEPVSEIEVSLSTQPSLNGDDGSVLLNITGGTGEYTFQWSGPNEFLSGDQNIDGLEPGFYTVLIQDSNGCFVNESILVTDVAVTELSNFDGIIYPQPASNYVTIEAARPIDQLDVYDLHGRRVALPITSLSQSKMRMDVGNMSAGAYLLFLHSKNTINRTILIVQ